jgi:hypothetical protein
MTRANPEFSSFGPIHWDRRTTDGTESSGVFNGADYSVYPTYRTYVGSVTPGYMSKSRRVKLKLETLDHIMSIQHDNGFEYKERISLGNVASYPNEQLYSSYNIANAVVVASFPSPVHLAEAYTKARARLADKVNGMSVNLAQALGERRQTADLLVSTATRIAAAALALRRGRLGDFASALSLGPHGIPSAKKWAKVAKTPVSKRISNHWLEYTYGWKPLLQDAFGVAELLANHLSTDRYNIGVSSSATAEEKIVIRGSGLGANSTKASKTKTKMSLTYRLDSSARSVLAQTGISNPALLAWELLPYSFVVDWFLPVGNYLQALDAFSGFQFVDGWISQKTTMTYEESVNATVLDFPGGPIWRKTSVNYGASTNRALYTRNRLYGFPPVGDLTFKSPLGGDPVSRLATAAALLRVLFK